MTEKCGCLDNKRVILLTPFYSQERGNKVTASRLFEGYLNRGLKADLVSLDDENWISRIGNILKGSESKVLHGFNVRYVGKALEKMPELREIPLLLTLTGTDLNLDMKQEKNYNFNKVLDWAYYLVVFQPYFAGLLLENYPEIKSKIRIIPQGVKIPSVTGKTRKDVGWDDDEIIFVLPSGIRPVKNILLAVEAFKKIYLSCPRVRLVILGPVIDRDYGEKVLEAIKNCSFIQYLGQIEHKKIGDYLALSDVVINCSLSEGQPQAALEAMGLGKPAILTAVPGNLGVIEDKKEGIYVNDMEELIAAAKFFLTHPQERKEMGKKAETLVKNKYQPEWEIDRYVELVCQIDN